MQIIKKNSIANHGVNKVNKGIRNIFILRLFALFQYNIDANPTLFFVVRGIGIVFALAGNFPPNFIEIIQVGLLEFHHSLEVFRRVVSSQLRE